ncbi:hypothetical protein NHX12_031071 [Muraenolepis orangiensis]|uniref:Uncharacterized protein n=1 Tax=Muraenolepis orangiensis TaxID=630683 RepID=A0A9Q0EB55_9TELE|nr:hypothetical protein NHX12_031071 [Muraenolepis orangiensis]
MEIDPERPTQHGEEVGGARENLQPPCGVPSDTASQPASSCLIANTDSVCLLLVGVERDTEGLSHQSSTPECNRVSSAVLRADTGCNGSLAELSASRGEAVNLLHYDPGGQS